MVNKLRAALDAAPLSVKSPPSASSSTKHYDAISVRSSTRDFEAYLRSLSRVSNLPDAKRIRNDIELNLRRARLPGGVLV